MPKHNKGEKLFVIVKPNLGRKVRLLDWLGPNTTLNYHDQFIFHGGETGGWIVVTVDGGAMVGRGVGDLPLISNVCLMKEENLAAVYIAGEIVVTQEDLAELKDLLDNGTRYMLSTDEFRAFEALLDANRLSENKALQTLLNQPNPWS